MRQRQPYGTELAEARRQRIDDAACDADVRNCVAVEKDVAAAEVNDRRKNRNATGDERDSARVTIDGEPSRFGVPFDFRQLGGGDHAHSVNKGKRQRANGKILLPTPRFCL